MTFGFDRAQLLAKYGLFRIRRKLHGARAFYGAADQSWVIAPAERQATPPSRILPGETEKIVKLEDRTTKEIENLRIAGGVFERPPVTAYRYSNAILFRGSVFAKGCEHKVLPYPFTPPPSREHPVETIDEGALAGSYLGLQYFGHWLHDDAPLALLADQFGDPVSPGPPAVHAKGHKESHIGGYVKLLDLPWRSAENVNFRSLVVINDEAPTPHKGPRLRLLRERVAAKLGAPEKKKRVFIRRGIQSGGVRKFCNEPEIENALSADGFEVLDPTMMSVDEIAGVLHGAELVVGMEGSALTHAMYFLPEGGGMLAITPPERFNSYCKVSCDLLGLQYGIVIGDRQAEGFCVNASNVRRTCDLFDL